MWNSHSSVGLAQTIFYTPALLAAVILLFRHRYEKPKWQWVVLLIFSIVRLTSGIVLIEYVSNSASVAWTIATVILLGAGVIPLLLALILHIVLIQKLDFPTNKPFKIGIIATRAIFLVGIATLIGGSILLGNYKNSNDVSLGSKLAEAGYLIITVVLFFAKCWATGLWLILKRLSPNSRKVLIAITCSIPFLAVRLVYALLSIFNDGQLWNPLSGSIAPLVVMHSLMEYIVVVICLITGYLLDPLHPVTDQGAGKTLLQESAQRSDSLENV